MLAFNIAFQLNYLKLGVARLLPAIKRLARAVADIFMRLRLVRCNKSIETG